MVTNGINIDMSEIPPPNKSWMHVPSNIHICRKVQQTVTTTVAKSGGQIEFIPVVSRLKTQMAMGRQS
jgi:hypothetical protein